MAPQPVRVAVFARQQLVLEALAEALETRPGMRVVGRTSTSAGLPQLLGSGRVDVLVLHAVTRQELSSDLVRTALARDHDLGIVLLTEAGAADLVRDALESGIRGWVCSDESLDRLVAAVREVGAHEVFMPVSRMTAVLAPQSVPTTSDASNRLLLRLTPRQQDVLRCLMDGCSRDETGRLLDMSPNTVRTHVGAILRRLQVHSTLAAVAEARRGGLLGRSAEGASTANGVGGLGR
ncbi:MULTISPECIES: DNA-binding response regulator [unclassified Terrabacter]|uniref:response regulator transcription factor n=1 Tax=unclassified Terrabacter TaxID=2630222 RepID=UPI0009EA52FA|nr:MULTISPECIES: response regulator transcription factor [unclassified Terrabacter]